MCVSISMQLFHHKASLWTCPMRFAPFGQMLGFDLVCKNTSLITLLAPPPLIHPRRRPLKCWSSGSSTHRELLLWRSSYLLYNWRGGQTLLQDSEIGRLEILQYMCSLVFHNILILMITYTVHTPNCFDHNTILFFFSVLWLNPHCPWLFYHDCDCFTCSIVFVVCACLLNIWGSTPLVHAGLLLAALIW